eukprot:CAMPEP_0202808440 /NCGR_PEP_ID=MMETSP1389-20130828/976_1 /ASSEMBLY_ACC=CAM_ASM_000865 /TAXON_ID=302021 /ORGANISM="Rhodomonas sp., Strain CCMP768" /LENGTH=65 /DNA_ID=CAMNT_0049478759 /DNA_START=167 /DNA_END=364 /DNA_ORIENTATION=-
MTFANYRRMAEADRMQASVEGQCKQTLLGGLESAEADSMKLGIPSMLQDALNAYAKHDNLTARRI